jgi:hypothetical protein
MSEYESALYAAVRVLGLAIIEMGANRNAIQAGLEEAQEDAATTGSKNGAATLGHLLDALFSPPRAYLPSEPN